jgi:multidrug efflux pump subunit AcrA (membrane-fusion protein)
MVLRTAIAILVICGATIPFADAEELVIEGLIVIPIDRIDVPARATGVLATIEVQEGQTVESGIVLARLDDAQQSIEVARAKTQLLIAEQVANLSIETSLAQKSLERAEQTAQEQQIELTIATRKAANDNRVRAAEKAEAVALNELKRATEARKVFQDSVSRSEIDGLTLAFQRAQLETQQAIFDREMDAHLVQAEDAKAVQQKLAIDESRLVLEKAKSDAAVAKLKARSAAHDMSLATLTLNHHSVISPISGVVVKMHRRPGQWVRVGEPVIELVRMGKLRAEGYVDQSIATKLRTLPSVELLLDEFPAQPSRRTGQLVFVMPEVDPVNGEVRFWVEFDNPDQAILPGMKLAIKVLL